MTNRNIFDNPLDQSEIANLTFGSADTNVHVPNYGRNLMPPMETSICEAINLHGQGEVISYATSLTVVPGEAPGQFVPVAIFVLTMDGLDGEVAYATNLSFDLRPTFDVISGQVKTLLDGMRAQRDEALDTPAG